MQLRPYQADAVAQLRAAYSSGKRAPLFVLPTGGGKTFVFSFVANNATARGKRVCILVHRQELLLQASRSLTAIGVKHGLIAPGHVQNQEAVQVASVQTLGRRIARQRFNFDLVIIDEAHHAVAGTWKRLIEAMPAARILGVTATPVRSDGKGLSDVFDHLVFGPSVESLIDMGFLVRPVVYAPPTALDMSGVRVRGGDFDQRDVADRMDKPTITGDAVKHYTRLCPGKPAIAFCASVAHAQHVAEQFKASGYSARSVDGTMLDSERRQAIADLGNGRLQVLTSCDIVSEGTDVPVVEAAILLRPTQSTGLYLQQVGRALRPAPGKDRAIILDHVGNCLRHGLPDDHREWSLDGAPRSARSKSDDEPDVTVKQCEKCFAVFKPSLVCPQCGHVHAAKAREIRETEGELQEVDPALLRAQQKREVGQARTLEALIEVAKRRGYKIGWAHQIWRARQSKHGATI
jgi:DNA repair protein RadD